jgi:hypothetical protein
MPDLDQIFTWPSSPDVAIALPACAQNTITCGRCAVGPLHLQGAELLEKLSPLRVLETVELLIASSGCQLVETNRTHHLGSSARTRQLHCELQRPFPACHCCV